jgi:hypothetical protein
MRNPAASMVAYSASNFRVKCQVDRSFKRPLCWSDDDSQNKSMRMSIRRVANRLIDD